MALYAPFRLQNPNFSLFPPPNSLSHSYPTSLRTFRTVRTIPSVPTAPPAPTFPTVRTVRTAARREFPTCAQDSSPQEFGQSGANSASPNSVGNSFRDSVGDSVGGSGGGSAEEASGKVPRKGWACMKGCGACCQLDKGPGAPPIEDILKDPEELQLYKSMVGPDGWCINYNKTLRTCSIYEDRPRFCRVEPSVFWDLFGIEDKYMDEEACNFCTDTIRDVYGGRSKEIKSFNKAIRDLKKSQKEQKLQKPLKSKSKK